MFLMIFKVLFVFPFWRIGCRSPRASRRASGQTTASGPVLFVSTAVSHSLPARALRNRAPLTRALVALHLQSPPIKPTAPSPHRWMNLQDRLPVPVTHPLLLFPLLERRGPVRIGLYCACVHVSGCFMAKVQRSWLIPFMWMYYVRYNNLLNS